MKTTSFFGITSARALAAALLGALAGLGAVPQVQAEITASSGATALTVSTTAGASITQHGTYFLNSNCTLNPGASITISTSNVVLDLNGHTLSVNGAPDPYTYAFGIYIAGGCSNVTVRNGTIKNFQYAVTIDYGDGPTLLEGLNMPAAVTDMGGITVCSNEFANNITVRDCRFSCSSVPGNSATWYGVYFVGKNERVINCDFAGSSDLSYGIALYIYCEDESLNAVAGSNSLVIGNRISGFANGVVSDAGSDPTIKCRDNTFAATVINRFFGLTDAGGNN